MQLISKTYKSFISNRLAEISGLVFLGLAFLTFGILFSYSSLDPSFNNITDQEAQNILGFTGARIALINTNIRFIKLCAYAIFFNLVLPTYHI